MKLEHTDKSYEKELVGLKDAILHMGSILQEMIAGSQKALVERKNDLANQVIARDKDVDDLEIDIHRRCTDILALRQPAAYDLRFIILGLRITTDFERIGDSTKNICNRIKDINQYDFIKEYVDLPKMFHLAEQMVHDSLDAFIEQDIELAQQILKRDDVIDNYQDKIEAELIELMQQKPILIRPATHLIGIVHKVERIADHATNVAEEVIYLIKGVDVRHQK